MQTQTALDALISDTAVQVERGAWITFTPMAAAPTTGFCAGGARASCWSRVNLLTINPKG
jgi:hypothetical protein